MTEPSTATAFEVGAENRLAAEAPVVFRETAGETIQRTVYGAAWGLKTFGFSGLVGTLKVFARDTLANEAVLPDPEAALESPWGLAGLVIDFSPDTIMKAYRRSLFPWAHLPPLKWWSLAERTVIVPSRYHFSKRLRRTMRKTPYRVTFDQNFADVMNACSEPRRSGRYLTWLTPAIKQAFYQLHQAGHAHSFEVWDEDGGLVGGGYGLAVGGVFHTESQFSRKSDTSKIGFTVLNHHLAEMDFALNDGKWYTPTIDAMGFRKISRRAFRDILDADGDRKVPTGRWHGNTDPQDIAANWYPEKRDG